MDRATAAAILGVPIDASAEEVRSAYHSMAGVVHPDRVGGDSDARIATATRLMSLATAARDSLALDDSEGQIAEIIEDALNAALAASFTRPALAPHRLLGALADLLSAVQGTASSDDHEQLVLAARESLVDAAINTSFDDSVDLRQLGGVIHFAVVLVDSGLSLRALASRRSQFDVEDFVRVQLQRQRSPLADPQIQGRAWVELLVGATSRKLDVEWIIAPMLDAIDGFGVSLDGAGRYGTLSVAADAWKLLLSKVDRDAHEVLKSAVRVAMESGVDASGLSGREARQLNAEFR